MEVGINMKGGIFRKKLVHNSNKRGVEGGKNLRNQETWRVDFFFKFSRRDFTFIREMRVIDYT